MIWDFLYWVLLSIAVVLLLRGLLWDRAGFRGRAKLRCRKCWYDLTGVDGDVSKGPVICPECGKKHASRRAMRKTRRGKRWVAAGLVVFVMAYSLRVTPAVKERGWWATVPSWVLITGIHQTPTYVKNPDNEWGAIAYGNNSVLERAMRELHVRARVEDLSWFDYQIVAWLARTEGDKSLCRSMRTRYEGVSPRAVGYCILIDRGLEVGKLGAFHRRWYQGLLDIEIHTRDTWPHDSVVYGEVIAMQASRYWQSRALVAPQLWMRVAGQSTSWFERPVGGVWNEVPFPHGGRRNLTVWDTGREWGSAIDGPVWSDNKVVLSSSEKYERTRLNVRVFEVRGYSGMPFDDRRLVSEREAHYEISRQGTINDYVNVLDDEDVRSEIERCVRAVGRYWHDIDGRWHAMFKLELVARPNLGARRYTFGSEFVQSISPGEEMTGTAWWALEPDSVGEWKLIHGGEYVPLYGRLDTPLDKDRNPDWVNLRFRSDPEICLRDDDAKLVVAGNFRLRLEWEPVRVWQR